MLGYTNSATFLMDLLTSMLSTSVPQFAFSDYMCTALLFLLGGGTCSALHAGSSVTGHFWNEKGSV